jgi:hypothetical protein
MCVLIASVTIVFAINKLAEITKSRRKIRMNDAEERATESPKAGESREQLVDDLASDDDYWLSVTDAARVTRRQEITIRRWIAVGELPVRRQRMGLNKRTRHVRASDLAKLTPIIDPTATITGAPANADLLSIPIQQAQLLTTQQDLVQRLAPLEHAVAVLVEQRAAEQDAQLHQQQLLAALHDEMTSRFQTTKEESDAQRHHLLDTLQAEMRNIQTALQEQIQHEIETRQTENQERATALKTLQKALGKWEAILDGLERQIEQDRQGMQQRWQNEVAQHHRERQAFEHEISAKWEQRLAAVQQEWRQQVEQLSSQHHEQQRFLQREQQHRLTLESHLRRLRLGQARQRVRPHEILKDTSKSTNM